MTLHIGDYVVFVDESGNLNLAPHDKDYPVFVLAFLVMKRDDYAQAEASLQQFKLHYFGRTDIVLHEHKISKHKGEFVILINAEIRNKFFADLNLFMQQLPCTIIATAIDKRRFFTHSLKPDNLYHLALEFCMERLTLFLKRRNSLLKTAILFESRGRMEDNELKKVFLRLRASGSHLSNQPLPFTLDFALKRANVAGLQIADLVARPIGRHVLKPDQTNRAFTILEKKFDSRPDGTYLGYGLKIFP